MRDHRTLKLTLAVLTFLLTSSFAKAKSRYYNVTILGARIKASKPGNRCWDGTCRGKTAKKMSSFDKEVQDMAIKHTVQQLFRIAKAKGLTGLSGLDPSGLSIAILGATAGYKSYMQSAKMPDPYAEIHVGSAHTIRTHEIKDTLTPDWGTEMRVPLYPGQSIRIHVKDKDLMRDDPIGYRHIRVPAHILARAHRKGSAHWTIKGLPNMHRLDLLIRPVKRTATRIRPGRYRVTMVRASISGRKSNGRSWDAFRGRPDPFARVQIGRYQLSTHVMKNNYGPIWNQSQFMTLTGKESMIIRIYDKDISRHDRIGFCRFSLSRQRLGSDGALLFRCEQATSIVIRFERL